MVEKKIDCQDCETHCIITSENVDDIIVCPFCGSTEINLEDNAESENDE